ncbi:hypothetical protein GO497_02975 [Acidovorax citrulli]|nr:hypothetical protein [Paracidovorax citrulli]
MAARFSAALTRYVTPPVYAHFPSKGCRNLVDFHRVAIRRFQCENDVKGGQGATPAPACTDRMNFPASRALYVNLPCVSFPEVEPQRLGFHAAAHHIALF